MNKLKILIVAGLMVMMSAGYVVGSYPFGYDIGMNSDSDDEVIMDA